METYEEKYKDLVKRLNKAREEKGVYTFNSVLDAVAPELKESDGDRIRKWIIENIQETLDVDGFFEGQKTMAKNAISWLEKQAEQKPADKVEPKFKVGDVIRLKGSAAEYTIKRVTDTKYYTDGWSCSIERCEEDYELVEQKPADNAEPKFKKGDWVVDKYGCVNQILSFRNGVYKHTQGYSAQVFEEDWHLWTIQDAKDGDVLCTYECDEPKIVFILKGTPKKHYALSYHCYYNIMYPHFGSNSEKGCLAPNDEDVKPATKEQRDILFQKMKESGYEWDDIKKELKKIEQNPAWSEEDKSKR